MATTVNTRYVDVDAAAAGDGTTTGLSGGTCAYKSLSIWEAARQADLTTGDGASNYVVERVVCGSNHANHTADTASVTVTGWTCSVNSYIDIKAETASRAGTAWSDTKYRLEITNAAGLTISESYTRVSWLQLKSIQSTSTRYTALSVAADAILCDGLVIRGDTSGNTATSAPRALNNDSAGTSTIFRNCIVYGFANGNATPKGIGFYCGGGALTLENCVSTGNRFGIQRGSGTCVATNCYAGSNPDGDYSGTITQTTNASSDTTATGTGLDSIAYDTSTGAGHAGFTNVTAGSEDFTLKAGSALLDVGTDLSATFTVDILGTTRPTGAGTWDIGAFEYVAAGGTAYDGSATLAASAAASTLSQLAYLGAGSFAATAAHAAASGVGFLGAGALPAAAAAMSGGRVGFFGAGALTSAALVPALSTIGFFGAGALAATAATTPGSGAGFLGASALPIVGTATGAGQLGLCGSQTLAALATLDAASLHAAMASASLGTAADLAASRAGVTAWLATATLQISATLPASGQLGLTGQAALAQLATLDATARQELLLSASLGVLAHVQGASQAAQTVSAALAILATAGVSSTASMTGAATLAAALALACSNQPTLAALFIDWLAETLLAAGATSETLTAAGGSAETLTSPAFTDETLRPS